MLLSLSHLRESFLIIPKHLVTTHKFSIIKIANLIRFRDLMLEKNCKSFGIIITRMKSNKILSKLIIYELNEIPNQLK